MKRSHFIVLGLATTALTALVFACGFDPPEKNPTPPTGASGGCFAGPGEFPTPDCDPRPAGPDGKPLAECPATASGICSETKTSSCCKIEAKCGDQSTCMPLSDNKGKSVIDLRMRRLNIAAPAALADPFIQNVVVTKNLDLKANGKGGPFCGETGQGAFNWLLRVDKTAGEMTTGGAPPVDDPFAKGYCFYQQKRGSITVESAKSKATFTGDSFDTASIPKLNVPIFVGGDINNVVVLPLSDATFKKITISADGNCVGKFAPGGVSKDCSDDPTACQKWHTAGSLGAYITIEEADEVEVRDLSSSLCVVLTKAPKNAQNKCPRGADGKVAAKGDYCSTSKKAGDCADSFWLAATFAASASIINDGSSTPECRGKTTTPPDAGSDAATDAAVDAPSDAPTSTDASTDAGVDAPTDAATGG